MSNHIFWLASYPKSGNTLLRSIIIALIFKKDGNFSFQDFKKIGQFDITELIDRNREIFGENISNLSNVEIFYKYILKLQTKKNLKLKKNWIFLKTHSGLFKILDSQFTTEKNTFGTIYMIRDPRDICISWSKHMGLSIDKTIEIMTNEHLKLQWNENKELKNIFNDENRPRSYLSSWNRHVLSWCLNRWNKPLKIIKFEDLVYKKKEIILEIMNFFENNYKFNFINKDEKINNIINSTEFENFKNEENLKGFIESTPFNNFFSVGKKNQWKNILNKYQIKKLENSFGDVMKKYGYELSNL